MNAPAGITTRTETLGAIAARQLFITDPLAAAIAKFGEAYVVVSRTRSTPFGEFLLGWDDVDVAADPFEREAHELMTATVASRGRGTLACECGAREVYLDADASAEDRFNVRMLISHARHDHPTPRTVLFTQPVSVYDTSVRPDVVAPAV